MNTQLNKHHASLHLHTYMHVSLSFSLSLSLYVYVCMYVSSRMCTYIHAERERERERDRCMDYDREHLFIVGHPVSQRKISWRRKHVQCTGEVLSLQVLTHQMRRCAVQNRSKNVTSFLAYSHDPPKACNLDQTYLQLQNPLPSKRDFIFRSDRKQALAV